MEKFDNLFTLKELIIRKKKMSKIATICGSNRFWDSILAVNAELTLKGWMVFQSGFNGHAEEAIKRFSSNEWEAIKLKLDRLHRKKIELAELIVIVDTNILTCANKKSYIGESTTNEIQYAQRLGKRIFYLSLTSINELPDISWPKIAL